MGKRTKYYRAIVILVLGVFKPLMCSEGKSDLLIDETTALEKSILHWNNYYSKRSAVSNPTPFALDCLKIIDKSLPLVELGCGNGRDALYFQDEGITVFGIDCSTVAIELLKKDFPEREEYFILRDFSLLGDLFVGKKVGTIYSRFTMHAVPKEVAHATYIWAFNQLCKNGLLLIEVRTTNDELYGYGTQVNNYAFFTDHYRRFVDVENLVKELTEIGFVIEKKICSKGLAKYKSEDPEVLRIFARKP